MNDVTLSAHKVVCGKIKENGSFLELRKIWYLDLLSTIAFRAMLCAGHTSGRGVMCTIIKITPKSVKQPFTACVNLSFSPPKKK